VIPSITAALIVVFTWRNRSRRLQETRELHGIFLNVRRTR
jgi:hypothetical protein